MLSLLLLFLFSNVMRIFVGAFFVFFCFCLFPNVNRIVSSSDIFFLSFSWFLLFTPNGTLSVGLIHKQDCGQLSVASRGLKTKLQNSRGFICLFIPHSWVVLTLDVYLGEPEIARNADSLPKNKKLLSHSRLRPLGPNPALFFNAVCFSNLLRFSQYKYLTAYL